MFKRETAPYLLTIVLALVGWLLTRAVDETTKSPLIAYSITDSKANNKRTYTVRLHNISSAAAFRNLYIILTNLDGTASKFVGADLQYEVPIHPRKEDKPVPDVGGTYAGCMIPELQPRTAVQFQTTIEGSGSPELRFDSAKDTVRLMKVGIVSFSVEHEAEILIYLACALGTLLLIYLYYLVKHP